MVQQEIWIKALIGNLFADNSFTSKAVNHSAFVNGKTVHVPNAGTIPGIKKDRNSFPATATSREDGDLSYSVASFTTDPIRVSNAEKVELSYDKRESIISSTRIGLEEAIASELIYNWLTDGVTKYKTTGEDVDAHLKEATGKRKKLTKKDIEELQTLFDEQGVPEKGRYILLDARMYNQLKNSMTDAESMHFIAGANAEKGTIGEYAGFSFFKRSRVAKAGANGKLKRWSEAATATDNAVGLAWSEHCVSIAKGESLLYTSDNDPSYYGDVISLEQRAGGACIRADKKGVIAIVQGA